MDVNIQSSTNTIKKLYDKLSYFDQYGGAVFMFIILTIIVLFVNGYCSVMKNAADVKRDWINQRCKPNVIPFAGLINKPADKSVSDFTLENFNYCTQKILVPVTTNAVSPFSYLVYGIQSIFATIATSIQEIRNMFNYIRNAFTEIMKEIFGRLLNFLIPIQQLILAARDMVAKVSGIMTTSLYTALGSYMTLKTLLGSIVEMAIGLLVGLIAIMILTFAFIPFLLPVTLSISAFCFAISIPLLILIIFLTDVMGIRPNSSIPGIPSIPSPSCFDKNVQIELFNGSTKPISQLQIGEKLVDGGIVTAKLKLDAKPMQCQMYDLGGTLVSGCHSVKFDGKWVNIRQHPHAIKVNNYDEPFLYCINTTTKVIHINNDVYIDWDEMYDFLKDKSKQQDMSYIHRHLDCGFVGDTLIQLQDKMQIRIIDVKVGDILANGEKVYGIVEIDGLNIEAQYLYKAFGFSGGPNLKMEYIGINENLVKHEINEVKLYHLLTDVKSFYVGDAKIYDYNHAIDNVVMGNGAEPP